MSKLNDIIPRHLAARWIRLLVATALLTIGAICQFTLATLMLVCSPNTCAAGSPGYGCIDGERICAQEAVWSCDGSSWRPVERCARTGAVCVEAIPGRAACELGPRCEAPPSAAPDLACEARAALCIEDIDDPLLPEEVRSP